MQSGLTHRDDELRPVYADMMVGLGVVLRVYVCACGARKSWAQWGAYYFCAVNEARRVASCGRPAWHPAAAGLPSQVKAACSRYL